ncbi:hypothetical protein SRHO_G00096070 [Serrasalmus rhombeus]
MTRSVNDLQDSQRGEKGPHRSVPLRPGRSVRLFWEKEGSAQLPQLSGHVPIRRLNGTGQPRGHEVSGGSRRRPAARIASSVEGGGVVPCKADRGPVKGAAVFSLYPLGRKGGRRARALPRVGDRRVRRRAGKQSKVRRSWGKKRSKVRRRGSCDPVITGHPAVPLHLISRRSPRFPCSFGATAANKPAR